MRYFFHLRETDEHVIDEEGQELPHLEAVATAALKNARSVIAHEALAGKLPLRAVIEVKDEAGRNVLVFPFRDAVILDG